MISAIYQSYGNILPPEVDTAIRNAIKQGIADRGPVKLFFRADDIGVPSKNYSQMMALFLKYRIPLCLAVVPSWITRQRWEAMQDLVKKGGELFCWHMHGFRHTNHETKGKKQEFGPARPPGKLFDDLSKGHDRLAAIMGHRLTPVFTPPWNRCTRETMVLLKKMGFQGISRDHGSLPEPPPGFRDFPVHVDLHTRKEKNATEGWRQIQKALTTGMASPACGIMLHHMCMNEQAFIFLEYLLALIAGNRQIETVTYKDLIGQRR